MEWNGRKRMGKMGGGGGGIKGEEERKEQTFCQSEDSSPDAPAPGDRIENIDARMKQAEQGVSHKSTTLKKPLGD